MSRKKSKHRQAVPAEVLAEGSDSTAEAAPDTEEIVAASSEAGEPSDQGEVLAAAAEAPTEAVADDVVEAKPATKADKKFKKFKKSKKAGNAAGDVAADAIEAKRDEMHARSADAEAGDGEMLHGDPDVIEGELRADGAAIAGELHADGAAIDDELHTDSGAIDGEPDADGGASSGELHADGGTDLAVRAVEGDAVEGDDVVGDPITDEAGVEAALLPGTLSAVQLRHLIEALIFATDKPVTLQRLRQLTRVADITRIEAALAELHEDYKERGIALTVVSGGYQFRTNTSFSSWVQQLIAGRPVRLSRAQLETLAIVAYRQPITRPEIDEIRGVDSSATLRLLLDRSLIRVLGKREEVGRPTLFGTTKEFLDFFSLGDLRELPTLREYSELTAESRQVMSERLGVPLDENGDLVEPETELLDDGLTTSDGDFTTDNASIVDSILAEHAAAEAAADRNGDASAMAEDAMAGGHVDTFSEAFSESSTSSVDSDGDAAAMSLSSDASSLGTPRSEARSYIDAIRSSSFVEAHAEPEPEPDDVEVKADSDLEAVGRDHTDLGEAGAAKLAEYADVTDLGGSEALDLAADESQESHEPLELHESDAADLAATDEVELAADEPHRAADLEASNVELADAADEPYLEASSVERTNISVADEVELAADDPHLEASNVEPANIELANISVADEVELAAGEPHQVADLEASNVVPTSLPVTDEVEPEADGAPGSQESSDLEATSPESALGESDAGSLETARIDLAHHGEPDEAELAAEAALEAANVAVRAAESSESDATGQHGNGNGNGDADADDNDDDHN